jgi:ABC-type multidrug transport system fused ATPase/permease subunit
MSAQATVKSSAPPDADLPAEEPMAPAGANLPQPDARPADSHAPGGVPYLPLPRVDAGTPQMDPELYAAWREHIRDGFRRNNEMFDRVLDAFMKPYYTTVWMYRILFGVGILSFLVAAGLSIWTREWSFGLVFGGLSVAAFVSFFIRNPLRSLEENLEFITWLGIVYNTYWTRLAYMLNEDTVQQDLAKATRDATREITRIIDKHAQMSGKRPGIE